MALAHRSVAVESGIEFIDLQPLDINPLMSKCEIKVFYLGKNRNNSYIDEGTAREMAKTLRGAPIVGYFKKDKEDFADHGEQVIIDDEGIHFNCLTIPYGFVSPDAKVWFKDFEDEDDFGNKVTRTYLMTTGYLWTEQFEEAKKVFEDEGKSQSMELDSKNLQGHWSTDLKDNIEFFIISDAIFSKLCILGDDVEPCYEGAAVTEPTVSRNFTLDDKFKNTLFTMMQELQQVLKGDTDMPMNEQLQGETPVNESTVEQEPAAEFSQEENSEVNSVESSTSENESNVEVGTESNVDFEKKNNDEEKDDGKEQDSDDDGKDEDKKKAEKSTLETSYNELQTNYTELQKELAELKASLKDLSQFKSNVEDKQKDALIAKFSMLSDEDKKDVIENKDKYSLEEIESKLAVIGFRKGVNFSYQEASETQEEAPVIYNFENANVSIPDWVKAVKENEQ